MFGFKSLSHSQRGCKYHLVFIPKRRKKRIFGKLKEQLKVIFHDLTKQKESSIIGGNLCNDHVHMILLVPSKYAVSSVIGFLKDIKCNGDSQGLMRKKKNFTGAHMWARG